jgi:hypothetical protein
MIRPGNLMFSRKTTAMEVHYLHKSHTLNLQNIFAKAKHIAFTLDAWTLPNTLAFLGITAHAIMPNWQLMNVVVGLSQIQGKMNFFYVENVSSQTWS